MRPEEPPSHLVSELSGARALVKKPTPRVLAPDHLVHRVFAEQPLEMVLAPRLELEARIALRVLLERRGHEDLTRLRMSRDSRREDHVAAQELIAARDHEAGVQANAERQGRL